MPLFLTAVSGITWSIVYISLLYHGFKDKACGMPLFALALNITWEFIYAYRIEIGFITGETPDTWAMHAQGIGTIVWAVLDCLLLYLYFRYEKRSFPRRTRKFFIPFNILVLISSFLLQIAFCLEFNRTRAPEYSAFIQNVLMSILFLNNLFSRKGTKGQSVIMAFCKWLGTLAPAILMGVMRELNIFIIICAIICSTFDIIYIVILISMKKKERNLERFT